MNRSLTRCLLLSLCACLLSCTSAYQGLRTASVDIACADKMMPRTIHTSWYQASVDVTNKHLSGLLLIKNMPDSSERVVFMNEAGVTFFDFGFDRHEKFMVFAITSKLNRKPVIRTLRKDFELMLGVAFAEGSLESWNTDGETYFGITGSKETAYCIVEKDCSSLR